MKDICHQPAVNLTDEDLAIFRSLKDMVYVLETAEESTEKSFANHPAFKRLKEIAWLEESTGKIPEYSNLQIIVDELIEEDFRHNSHFIPCNGAFIALMRVARMQELQRIIKEELNFK